MPEPQSSIESNEAILRTNTGACPLLFHFALTLNEERFRGTAATELELCVKRIAQTKHDPKVTARRRYFLADYAVRTILPRMLMVVGRPSIPDLPAVVDSSTARNAVTTIQSHTSYPKTYPGDHSNSCLSEIAQLCQLVALEGNEPAIVKHFMRALEEPRHTWEELFADDHGYYPSDAEISEARRERRAEYVAVLVSLLNIT